jgi:hypothetical protein
MAGRFARRVKAWGQANDVPVIFCTSGQRKHRIFEERFAARLPSGPGVFLVLAAKAPVFKVRRSACGRIVSIDKKGEHVYHYSFHIIDPDWGHVTIKVSGHPPFAAQVILNGHEYVAAQAQAAGIGFTKEGNCFTEIADPQGLAQIADAVPRQAAMGRLGQVLRPVDLHRLPVLRSGSRAGHERIPLRLLRLPGRVLPQPDVRLRRQDGGPVRTGA